MTSTKAKLEFVHAMARNTRATVRQCEALMRYAGTLQRLAELECNHGLTERDQRKEDRIKSAVILLCTDIALEELPMDGTCVSPLFQNDPRGAVLKIRVPSGYTNDFGGEGICVPS